MNWFKKKAPPTPDMLANTEAFTKFRGNVPLQRATVGITNPKTWKFYDCGDESKAPIVMLPPAAGTAEGYFKLMNELPERGIRIIAVQNPPIIDHDEWIESFAAFLDHIKLKRVHLLGSGLGGFLVLLFTRIHQKRVISTILINSYAANIALQQPTVKFEFAPAFVLRNYLTQSLQTQPAAATKNLASVDFFKKQMESLTQEELFSSLSLMCTEAYIDKKKIDSKTLTIMETDDFSSLNERVKGTCASFFPTATLVPLKKGGDFPYISVADEVCLYITVHMRRLDPSLLPAISLDSSSAAFSHDRDGKRFGKSVLSVPTSGRDDDDDEEEEEEERPAPKKKKAPAKRNEDDEDDDSLGYSSSPSSSKKKGKTPLDDDDDDDDDNEDEKTEVSAGTSAVSGKATAGAAKAAKYKDDDDDDDGRSSDVSSGSYSSSIASDNTSSTSYSSSTSASTSSSSLSSSGSDDDDDDEAPMFKKKSEPAPAQKPRASGFFDDDDDDGL
ncbi:putative acid cluster protein 33 [Monocercomonoides exilis]|uniref:putative acid cluster protein 33 n=1 Tax=Monocercomonoides exilis TaxID=2049356 RepID=UPI00355A9821|nr:putative acid cluster protein 33 [Monocercomonoides exilis]|eukprot:MONOS_3265.1-p1 / transcript=MONOS_3265.1 / gene=MONOS_3265 / organism=Monocercomonoides_exilis_PA203 / gene_product=putative acid cluster protein 33 / transcript_product=putative acid cluster protein 33 / location=Mono_scaffold00075:105167-106994(-) / protein_length=499 / sequence_SO=supercontig / SO=protein_coding / is_pseudo=false